MSHRRVYLGGEGRNELGSRCGHPSYRTEDELGVIEALLRAIRSDGWSVAGAREWRTIRKLDAKGPTPNDERNVLALALEAKRSAADTLAFVRDEDDDEARPRIIADAVLKAECLFPDIKIIGAASVPVLEGWLLAIEGEHRTEQLSKAAAQGRLRERGVETTAHMVDIAHRADIRRIPADAESLGGWLRLATEALALASRLAGDGNE